MSKEVWVHAQTNLLEALNNQEYDFLLQYAEDNQEYVIAEWFNSDHSSFSQTLRYGNSQLKYFKHHLEKSSKDNAIFHLGILMGIIDTMEHFSYEEEQESLTANIYLKQVLSIKHLKDIIQLLESHGVMNHSEICKNLDLKESTLSEIMKKTNPTNLIDSTRAGKYKLYKLTDTGRYLSRQLRSSFSETHNKQKISVFLSDNQETIEEKSFFTKQQPNTWFKDSKIEITSDNNFNDLERISNRKNLPRHTGILFPNDTFYSVNQTMKNSNRANKRVNSISNFNNYNNERELV